MKSDDFMPPSAQSKKMNFGMLTKVLLIIGGLNWCVTALRMKASDPPVKDLLQYGEDMASKLPIKFANLQRGVYLAVALSAAFQVTQLSAP